VSGARDMRSSAGASSLRPCETKTHVCPAASSRRDSAEMAKKAANFILLLIAERCKWTISGMLSVKAAPGTGGHIGILQNRWCPVYSVSFSQRHTTPPAPRSPSVHVHPAARVVLGSYQRGPAIQSHKRIPACSINAGRRRCWTICFRMCPVVSRPVQVVGSIR
jgi:hypothetical protein